MNTKDMDNCTHNDNDTISDVRNVTNHARSRDDDNRGGNASIGVFLCL